MLFSCFSSSRLKSLSRAAFATSTRFDLVGFPFPPRWVNSSGQNFLFPVLQQLFIGQVLRQLYPGVSQTYAGTCHVEERCGIQYGIRSGNVPLVGIDSHSVLSGLVDYSRQLIFRVFYFECGAEEHHPLVRWIVPHVSFTALARVAIQQVVGYLPVWSGTVSFRVFLHEGVHEFQCHRSSFRHVSPVVNTPDFKEEVLVPFRGIGYQCRPGVERCLDLSIQFVAALSYAFSDCPC